MRLYLILLTGAFATSACAWPRPSNISPVPSEIAESIRRLEGQRDAAYVRRDSATLDRILADDYVRTTTGALVRNKANVIQHYLHLAGPFDTAFTRDVVIRPFGKVAVVRGVHEYRYKSAAGAPVIERSRYLDVWVFRDGRWQDVATQSTTFPDSSK